MELLQFTENVITPPPKYAKTMGGEIIGSISDGIGLTPSLARNFLQGFTGLFVKHTKSDILGRYTFKQDPTQLTFFEPGFGCYCDITLNGSYYNDMEVWSNNLPGVINFFITSDHGNGYDLVSCSYNISNKSWSVNNGDLSNEIVNISDIDLTINKVNGDITGADNLKTFASEECHFTPNLIATNELTVFGSFSFIMLGLSIAFGVVSLVVHLVRGNTGA